MISNEILERFKNLYYKKFNVVLNNEEATKMATDLVNLVRVLLKPDPKIDNPTTSLEPERRQEDETFRTQFL